MIRKQNMLLKMKKRNEFLKNYEVLIFNDKYSNAIYKLLFKLTIFENFDNLLSTDFYAYPKNKNIAHIYIAAIFFKIQCNAQ